MPKLPVLILLPLISLPAISQQTCPAPPDKSLRAPMLFAGFKNNSEDGVYFALSLDGYCWTLANNGQPILHPTEPGELMRDPFIQRAPDNTFRMVWTWSWRTPAVIGLSTSTDLVRWTPHRQLPVMANEPAALNVWAPALYFEPTQNRWLIFWSSTIPGRFPGDDTGDNHLNHRIFSTTTRDFTAFAPAKVFFDPGFSVIDATVFQRTPSETVLIFKDERANPQKKHLQTATGPTLEGPWSNLSQPISETWSEGAAIISVHTQGKAAWLAFYDHYRAPQHYGALLTTDFKTWSDATPQITFPPGLRHGSFLKLTEAEYTRLANLSDHRLKACGLGCD